jgi:acetate kinase
VRVLVVNAGSSSLKLRLLGHDDELLASPGIDDLADLEPDAVGHRIVHGGTRFRDAVVIDDAVRDALSELTELAPLHQPKSLAALDAVSKALPGVPAVACFDTAFHATLPDHARTYAVPLEWRERWNVRRFGFHGLSHAYASRRAAAMLGRDGLRVVTCHLGAGASLCAVAGGRSVDTTMGFTPLEGLVMATRSGSVDPGMLLWLLGRERLAEDEMAEALEHSSGLLALGGSADMRELLARDAQEDDAAALALGVYLHRLRSGIAAMAAALGGLDALVFTGGVGENSPPIRARAAEGLGFLGVEVDADLNEQTAGDRDVSSDGAPSRTLVVEAREDLEIARDVRALIT